MTLREAIARLRAAGIDNAAGEGRMLFAHFGGFGDGELFGKNPVCDAPALHAALARRCAHEPLAYILGEWDFYRERYRVTPEVLVPRADTERLVEVAVQRLAPGARFADLCTGSGCVGLSVLANTKGTDALLLEQSDGALAVARENARRLGLDARVRFLQENVLTYKPHEKYYAVLSNPPYIAEDVYYTLQPEIFQEPKEAFVAGEGGMEFYRAILELWRKSLLPDGFFAMEIGYDQKEKIDALAKILGYTCEILSDYGGNPRVAVLTTR